MGRIRVAYCLDNMDIGGTEMNAVRTAERLDPARFELSVICLRGEGPLRQRYEALGVPVRERALGSLFSSAFVREGRRLATFLRDEGIDIVHSHDVYMNIFAVPWARRAGVPVVIASRRWWNVVNRPVHRLANRLSYRFATCILGNSPSVGELLVREEGVPREKLVVIPNFVDDDAFDPLPSATIESLRREFGIERETLSIGIVANLHPVKEHHVLLRALSRLAPRYPLLRLVLIGDGSCRSELERLAGELGIAQNVCFAGRRPHQPGVQQLFDIAVLCSREEGFPNTVVEGMAAGRPIVATRVGGIVDAVVAEETGLLVPPSHEEALAGALDRLLRDAALRERMGTAGRERARALYHRRVVMVAVDQMYSSRLASAVRAQQ